MNAPVLSSASPTDMDAALAHPSLLHREAQRLAAQLETTMHDPTAQQEDFLQAVDRYAEVLHTLRKATTTAEDILTHPAPEPTPRWNSPDVNLIKGFALICVFVLSVLFAL